LEPGSEPKGCVTRRHFGGCDRVSETDVCETTKTRTLTQVGARPELEAENNVPLRSERMAYATTTVDR
jgi:hypothetical protein